MSHPSSKSHIFLQEMPMLVSNPRSPAEHEGQCDHHLLGQLGGGYVYAAMCMLHLESNLSMLTWIA